MLKFVKKSYLNRVKGLAAIVLMGVLLFNIAGYRVVFSMLESKSHQQLNARLDQEITDEAALITIKVPINELPYYTNSPIFERTKGTISIGGMTYQYVERRIYNDSLEMRCIPNAEATQLTNARDLFFQLVNDLQHTNSTGKQAPAKPVLALKNTLSDYTLLETLKGFEPVFISKIVSFQLFVAPKANGIYSIQEQPPDQFVTV